ncbi:MAG: zinc ribbon domain-containing protein [Syntrophomonadaceae bacterium]|jgi:hypothetical protein
MNCPQCGQTIPNNKEVCPDCGFDLNQCSWKIIARVYPPQDVIIESMLRSCDIPVRLFREAIGSVQGLAIGPLAEVKIAVPEIMADTASALIQAEESPD